MLTPVGWDDQVAMMSARQDVPSRVALPSPAPTTSALTTVEVIARQPREGVLEFVEGQRPFDDDAAAVLLE